MYIALCAHFAFIVLIKRGHCCPRASSKCPVGEPRPLSPTCSTRDNNCPSDTHYCYSPGRVDHQAQEALCCPKPCPGDSVYRDGRCYQHKSMSEPCEFDEQCERVKAKCVKGICVCGPNAVLLPSVFPEQCVLSCRPNEVQIGTDCVKRLRIGDPCENDRLCATGALCRHGKCQCGCDMIQLAEDICGAPPSCPPLIFNVLGLPTVTPVRHPVFCHAHPFGEPVSTAKHNPELMFAVPVVNECPAQHFCNNYQPWFGLGVCCRVPDPVCPDGSRPDKDDSCDPRNPNSCRGGESCHRFYTPANELHSTKGFVCCSLLKMAALTRQSDGVVVDMMG